MAAARQKSVALLLPTPEANRWGVHLALVDGRSDKEYRIVVDETRTVFQWGRRGSDGETQSKQHATSEDARKAALKQWSAKEAKGYWPVTGILALSGAAAGRTSGYGARATISSAYRDAAARLSGFEVGEELWLCQIPRWEAPSDGAEVVKALAVASGLTPAGASLAGGSYCLLAVPKEAAADVQAVCPIAMRAGTLAERTVAEIAETLWRDDDELPPRAALGRAIEIAKIIA